MQIHELNNFTGTLGSGAYLAIDDGTDTGKISSQGLLAATEARIDNIIAGPAPSAEEIVDARLGADGVTYPSLGDAIRDQFTDVKSALKPLYAEVNPELIADSYYPYTGTSKGIPTAYTGWSRTNRIPCTEGETLYITTTVASRYNVFFNSDTDGDFNSDINLQVGLNKVKVPTGATYYGLSNTTEGMEATEILQIIDGDDVTANFTETKKATADIKEVGIYAKYYSPNENIPINNLVSVGTTQRRTDYFDAIRVASVTVDAASGFEHNTGYYIESESDAATEVGWQATQTTFKKPSKSYTKWYVKFRKTDASAFSSDDVASLLSLISITTTYETIDITREVIHVSTTGNDSNDGTKASPLRTLQKAVDSGALIIRVEAGEYIGFTVQNRETPLTIMLESMPSEPLPGYDIDTPDVPKIKITTGIGATGYGLYAYKCSEINLSDVWVNGVNGDCMYFQDVGSVNCTRCYVSNNIDSNRMGFRLVSCNGVFRDCKAWNIIKDGFNIHGYGNTEFINCIAHDCGDDGISHHDGCTGLILGGEYYNCYKGGVSSPYGGSIIDIQNVYIHDCTQYGIYSMSSDEMLKSSGKISNCVIKDNGSFDIIASYTDLIGWNNIYDTKSIGTQATFMEF